jgi:hypothetical protein
MDMVIGKCGYKLHLGRAFIFDENTVYKKSCPMILGQLQECFLLDFNKT